MKIIKGTEKGFFAVANDTARHISQCIQNNEEWFVGWGEETLYYDSSHGSNVWEYYFKQTYTYTEPNNVVSDYTEVVRNGSFRETMYFIYSNFFILNEKTEKLLSTHYDFFANNNVLGVHIRRTDKFLSGTGPNLAPVDLHLFKKEIDEVINNYDAIYLATDCAEAYQYIKNLYGKKVIANQNGNRGTGTQSIHNDYKHISGYKKGLDVLTDVIYLSKCKHLIRSSSNVSVTSLYINPELTYLNLNEKYLGDNESCIVA